jgi:predicted methyltransferase MtxX (methanogen marker protein 4)
VRSHAYWLAGRVALELNLRETARVMAEQALLAAVGVDTGQCVADAYRLLADVDNRFVRE